MTPAGRFVTFAITASLGAGLPGVASAQSRSRAVPRGSTTVIHGGPVYGGGRVGAPPRPVVVAPGYGHYYRPYPYYPTFNLGFFFGAPGFFGAYAYASPFYGYGFPVYGYPAYRSPGYVYPPPYPSPGYGYPPPYPYGGYAYPPSNGYPSSLIPIPNANGNRNSNPQSAYGYGGYSGRPYGGVRLDLPQRDAEVVIDGYLAGVVDDFDSRAQQANLEAGPHHIEIRAEGFAPLSFEANVEAGRTLTYRGDLQPVQ